MWLAHYTSSGLEYVLNMEVPLFERMLKASTKGYEEIKKAESKLPQYVILVEPKEE